MEEEDFTAMDVLFIGSNGDSLRAFGRNHLAIDSKEWSFLLKNHPNDSLSVLVRAKKGQNWFQYRPFPLYIQSDSIDHSIVYRLISPGYQTYSEMGIYQRTLADFNQTALYENSEITNSCINCHTFCNGNPAIQSVHIRGKYGATVLVNEGEIATYESRIDSTLATAVYPSWHPSGRYIAYSTNRVRQLFHTTAENLMESYDLESDLYIYDIQNNELIHNQITKHPDYFETNPCFSADGKTLYFCRTQKHDMPKEVTQVRYDLCSVSFNPETGVLGGKLDTLILAAERGKSISLPRTTPDGRYLLYCESDYGSFPLYRKEADLAILDLATQKSRVMDEINSDYADAFHNFSSNSRWLVFGSRREDGVHTRLYFTYIDAYGVGRKPFLLPQPNPKGYYTDLMRSYNCAEFVRGEVRFNARQIAKRVYARKNRPMKVQQP